jgi:hypothetical protein
MTEQEFNAWAYEHVKHYLDDTLLFTAEEKRGVGRVKAFVAGLESNRQILVKEDRPEMKWCATGRSFTKGDSFPAGIQGRWIVVDPDGAVWELLKFNNDGVAVLHCRSTDATRTWVDLLDEHGTLRELSEVSD